MTEKNAIYISSITGGKCIENTQKDKGECRLRKWIKTTEQQWIVESSESDATTVAFRSVSDQQYLAALQPDKRNGGKIGVQAEKQWWTLEPGMGPGWWHVKSNSSFGGGKAGYLNDEWGRWKDDNKLQTYEYEAKNPHFNTFYFPAAQIADSGTPDFSSAAKEDQAAKKEDLDAREQSLKEREAAAKETEQNYAKDNNALKEREDALKKREEALAEEEKISKTARTSNQDQDAKQKKALEEKEAALAKREKELAEKEKGDEVSSTTFKEDDNLEQKKRALGQKEDALAKREAELARREKELNSTAGRTPVTPAASSTAPSEPLKAVTAQNGTTSDGDSHELCRLLRENDTLKLKVKIGDLEAQLRDRACNHKIKRPPRKIECKVEGYVYKT